MTKIVFITPQFAVAGAIGPNDFKELAEQGFKTVVGNRTDTEVPDVLRGAILAKAAAALGVNYVHVPASKFELFTDPVISGMERALDDADGPVLAHCASGQRSAIGWAATQVWQRPVNEVLSDLSRAGFKLDFIRDDLEAQADRARWRNTANDTALPTPETQPLPLTLQATAA